MKYVKLRTQARPSFFILHNVTKKCVFDFQSYCHVLTITMEMLEVDWLRHFKMTFHQVIFFANNVKLIIMTGSLSIVWFGYSYTILVKPMVLHIKGNLVLLFTFKIHILGT